MYARVEKSQKNVSRAVTNSVSQKQSNRKKGFGFEDHRPETIYFQRRQHLPYERTSTTPENGKVMQCMTDRNISSLITKENIEKVLPFGLYRFDSRRPQEIAHCGFRARRETNGTLEPPTTSLMAHVESAGQDEVKAVTPWVSTGGELLLANPGQLSGNGYLYHIGKDEIARYHKGGFVDANRFFKEHKRENGYETQDEFSTDRRIEPQCIVGWMTTLEFLRIFNDVMPRIGAQGLPEALNNGWKRMPILQLQFHDPDNPDLTDYAEWAD